MNLVMFVLPHDFCLLVALMKGRHLPPGTVSWRRGATVTSPLPRSHSCGLPGILVGSHCLRFDSYPPPPPFFNTLGVLVRQFGCEMPFNVDFDSLSPPVYVQLVPSCVRTYATIAL